MTDKEPQEDNNNNHQDNTQENGFVDTSNQTKLEEGRDGPMDNIQSNTVKLSIKPSSNESSNPSTLLLKNPLSLPHPISLKQKLYLIGLQTILAACISAGINFAVAYGMYHDADPIEFWSISHHTIAGDLGVTIFIQGILSYIIISALVNMDMKNRLIQPFQQPWPNMNEVNNKKPFFNRILQFFAGSEKQNLLDFQVGFRGFFKRFRYTIYRGFMLSLIYFFILWPIALAILAPIYSSKNMSQSWTPQIIKAVYGGIYGILQSPIVAMLVLGSSYAVMKYNQEQKTEN